MSNLLNDLYFGKITPCARPLTQCQQQKLLDSRIDEELQYLASRLPQQDLPRLQGLESLYLESNGFEEADAFSFGFRLGAALMAEAFFGLPFPEG